MGKRKPTKRKHVTARFADGSVYDFGPYESKSGAEQVYESWRLFTDARLRKVYGIPLSALPVHRGNILVAKVINAVGYQDLTAAVDIIDSWARRKQSGDK